MAKFCLAMTIIAAVAFIVLIIVIEVKKQAYIKQAKKEMKDILNAQKKADEKKDSVHTGDNVADFNASLNIVSDNARRTGK